MILIAAALNAPLIGVLPRWRHRLHAVTMEGVVDGWEKGSFVSACGIKGMKFFPATFEENPEGDRLAAPWPPRIKGLPEGFIRCRTCWVATGKKPPRCHYKPRETSYQENPVTNNANA